MFYLENKKITDPHLNLALEEYLLRHVVDDEAILFFYVNSQAVIIGRNQNVFEEVDFRTLRKHSIPVLRRLSGGGAVFHDLGNLNYSLITPDQKLLNNYTAFTRPVIRALRSLGLPAELRQRSSIFIRDKKISGNAQYASAGRLVSHGTLLWQSDLDDLRQAIRPGHDQVQSKAVRSVRNPVANLRDMLDETVTLDFVKGRIRQEFLGTSDATSFEPGDADWQVVEAMAEERYRSWAWNIGRSPKFTSIRKAAVPGGELILAITVARGTIEDIGLVNCPPGTETIYRAICECLQGIRYNRNDLAAALRTCTVGSTMPVLTATELLDLLYWLV